MPIRILYRVQRWLRMRVEKCCCIVPPSAALATVHARAGRLEEPSCADWHRSRPICHRQCCSYTRSVHVDSSTGGRLRCDG